MAKPHRRKGFKAASNYDPRRGRDNRSGRNRRTDNRSPSSDGQPEHAQQGRQAGRSERPGRKRGQDRVLAKIDAKRTTAEEVRGLTFADLGLGNNIVATLTELGAKEPFPIQGATIPDILAGHHVLGRAQTGSGKTIAFGAGVVERLLKLKAQGLLPPSTQRAHARSTRAHKQRQRGRNPRALILAPTRELALQIDETVQPIARSVGLYTTQVYGGVPQAPQVNALRMGVDIVVGTPGRVEDLVRQGHLQLQDVRITVLDEADHMSDLGFIEPVQRILRLTHPEGQRLLFSATLDAAVTGLIREFLPLHRAHEVVQELRLSRNITHRVLVVSRENKTQIIEEIAQLPGKKLMFVRTRAYADQLTERLQQRGTTAASLHGNMSQHRRTRNLERFTRGTCDLLIATDVAARGIHVDNVELVVQADAPEDYKTYLHRAGRTGRAGATGEVITLIFRTGERRMKDLLQRAGVVPNDFRSVAPGSLQSPPEV